MLEIILPDGRKYDFKALVDRVQEFGREYLLYDFGCGNAPLWLIKDNPFYEFMEPIIAQEKNPSLNSEEKKFVRDVSNLYKAITSFDRNHYRSLDKKSKESYLREQGRLFLKLLKPFGGEPERYFSICNLMPFMEIDGRLFPPRIWRYGKGWSDK